MSIIKAIDKSFARAKESNWDTVYWAIDLHGTISKFNYSNDDLEPDYYPYAKEVLQELSKIKNIKLILYTCSYPENCYKLLKIFNNHGIKFDYINENPEVKNTKYGDYSKKLYFNVLLEDKAGFDPENDWFSILQYINEISINCNVL